MRILRVMFRVGDLERSITFYTEGLGMRLLRRQEYAEAKCTVALLGYQDQASGAGLQLTYHWGTNQVEQGNAFGNLAIEVVDLAQACVDVQRHGGTVVCDGSPIGHGATVVDPDGYALALSQKGVPRPA